MKLKKNRGKYTWAMVVIAVLLVISATLLAIVLIDWSDRDSVSPHNVIGKEAAASDLIYRNTLYISNVPVMALADVSSSGSDKITIAWWTGYDGSKTFKVGNMLPGDEEFKEYKISIKTAKGKSLAFDTEITSDSLLSKVLNIKIEANGNLLYDGVIKNMEEVSFALAEGVSSQDVNYKITVSLPTSAGNEYAGLSLKVKFIWTLSEEESVTPPDTDPPTPPDTDPPVPPDTDPPVPPDTDPPVPPDTDPSDSETESDSESESDSDSETESDSETGGGSGTDTDTDIDSDTETGGGSGTDSDSETDSGSGTESDTGTGTDPLPPPEEPEKCEKCFIEHFWEDLFGESGDRCPICRFVTALLGADTAACICPWGCLIFIIIVIALIVTAIWGSFKLVDYITKKQKKKKGEPEEK